GGSSGWYEQMVANGPGRLRAYGEYLGRRYRDFTNILWMHGGDYNPPERTLVRAIVQGIRTHDHRALHSSHMAPDMAALDYWKDEPWLDVNTVYTYGPTYAPVLAQHSRADHLPLFLIESAYENEHEATERRLRTQAYHALLSGAFGHVFGNNPIWHFGSGGLYPAPVTWPEALDSPGARSMTHLRKLMTAFPWWHLQPDVDHSMLTDGLGTGEDRAVSVRSADGALALIYRPSEREIVVGLNQLAGPQVVAHWYEPTDGRQSEARESPFQARGSRRFRPERPANQSGFDDWVLILQSHSAGSSQTEAGATL